MCSGSSLVGFKMDDWVFGKGAVGSVELLNKLRAYNDIQLND